MNLLTATSASRAVDYVGLFALFLFSFAAFKHVAHANFAFALLLLATLIKLPTFWRGLLKDHLFRIALVFILYIALRTLWALWHPSVPPGDILDGCDYWIRRSFLPALVVAYWLNGDARRIRICIFLLMAGFVANVLVHLDWQLVTALVSGARRARFDNSPVNFGLWSAVMTLGALVLGHSFLRGTHKRSLFWCKLILWAAYLLIVVNGLILSQSRGAWIAAIAVIPVCLLWLAWRRPGGQSMRNLLGWCAIGCAIIGVIGALNYDTVAERLSQEHKTFAAILDGDLSDVPPTSVGLRVDMFASAWSYWTQKPVFGWGPGTSRALIERAGKPIAGYGFTHFHNGYIDTLNQLGIVGFGLFTTLLLILSTTLRNASRSRSLPPNVVIFIIGTFALVGIVALINKPLGSRFGDYFLALFAGFSYTTCLAARLQRTMPAQQHASSKGVVNPAVQGERLAAHPLHASTSKNKAGP